MPRLQIKKNTRWASRKRRSVAILINNVARTRVLPFHGFYEIRELRGGGGSAKIFIGNTK